VSSSLTEGCFFFFFLVICVVPLQVFGNVFEVLFIDLRKGNDVQSHFPMPFRNSVFNVECFKVSEKDLVGSRELFG
jgi:hypothetical protein